MIKELEIKLEGLREHSKKVEALEDRDIAEKFKEDLIIEGKKLIKQAQKNLSPMDRVYLARHKNRPRAVEFAEGIFEDIHVLKGDRAFGEDGAIVGGIARLNGRPITFIATNKGRNLEESIKVNFGMPNPEGYRKAKRLMEQAEKFRRPIITLIDTSGAYPGLEAEERGQGEAIARSIMFMSGLTVPVIAVITGEGGSGGALALAVGNRVIMMENSIYSILSPEGFATILWKDSSKVEQATEIMKLTAHDLLEKGIIDKVVQEDISFEKEGFKENIQRLKKAIEQELESLLPLDKQELQNQRVEKFRNMGE